MGYVVGVTAFFVVSEVLSCGLTRFFEEPATAFAWP
jgi:hypothetical protein